MTTTAILSSIRKLRTAERIAKDAFYAQHAAESKPGYKPSAKYTKLQGAMITATKARQAAMLQLSDAMAK